MSDSVKIGGYAWVPRALGPSKGNRLAVLWRHEEDRLSVAAAALGLSYVHAGGPFPLWGEASAAGSLVAFGDAVVDHLCERGAKIGDIMRAGLPLVTKAMESYNAAAMPSRAEVDEARDFS